MLQDEDNVEDFSKKVSISFNNDYEVMEANAWKICRQNFVTDSLTQVIDVQQRTKTPSQSGNVKRLCKIRAKRKVPYVNDND